MAGWGRWVGAPGQPPPYVVWQQAQGVAVTSLAALESNDVVGVQGRAVLLASQGRGVAGG